MDNLNEQFDIIYTTGAFLKPVKAFDKEGNETWFWKVVEFDGPCFENGLEISVKENSSIFWDLKSEIY